MELQLPAFLATQLAFSVRDPAQQIAYHVHLAANYLPQPASVYLAFTLPVSVVSPATTRARLAHLALPTAASPATQITIGSSTLQTPPVPVC